MNLGPGQLEAWQELYAAAGRVSDLGPWKWMSEMDVFGIQVPSTAELVFASVMGELGEHYAVAAYRGASALYSFLAMTVDQDSPPESVLEVPMIQASFGGRNELRKEDHEIIKRLGLRFRGANAWPAFRSYRPGYLPWFLEDDEIEVLRLILEQVLDVAPRVKDDPALVNASDSHTFLVRVQRAQPPTWEDQRMDIMPPEPERIESFIDPKLIDKVRSSPKSRSNIELDLFLVPTPVREGEGRPLLPYMLLSVDARNGVIIGQSLLTADPSLQVMWSGVPQRVLGQLLEAGRLPSEITVRSGVLPDLLRPLATMGIKVKSARHLAKLDSAKNSLLDFLSQGPGGA